MTQQDPGRAKTRMIIALFFLVLGVIYTVSPIDLIPDFFGPIGWVDDIGVLSITALNAVFSYYRFCRAEKKAAAQRDRIERRDGE